MLDKLIYIVYVFLFFLLISLLNYVKKGATSAALKTEFSSFWINKIFFYYLIL